MKRFSICKRRILLVVFVLLLMPAGGRAADDTHFEPVGLFLTWQRDPTSTMTIDWHTEQPVDAPVLEFRQLGASQWLTGQAQSRLFPFSESRFIHRVELTGLESSSSYEFRFGENSKVYRFRTMPIRADRPIRFVAGGDVRHNKEWMVQTNLRVLPYDPDFIMFGGDLAYANGMEDAIDRWFEWFDAVKTSLVTEEGRVIPILPGIGNHEVRGGYYTNDEAAPRRDLPPYAGDDASRAAIAPYYYEIFAMPGQPGYNVLDFGDYMSVILLDTDHTNPIDGEQTAWLESVLAARQHVPHIFPIYHVPAYPSVRSYDGRTHLRVRKNWVPLFERYGVRVAFENHDHIYKRTYPLRNNELSSSGVVYLGDGAWGVGTREIGRDNEGGVPWYLENAASVRHFILGIVHGPHQHFLAVDEDGNVFDEYPRTPHLQLPEFLPEEPELEETAAAGMR